MILCCGDALVDMLPRRLAEGGDGYMPVAGGAVLNTAIALGRLGEEAGFFCGLSRDVFGKVLAETLTGSGVDHSLCPLSDRPTTLAFVRFENGNARYTFYDEGTAGSMLSVADLPEMPASVRALHFGAISLIGEPCGSAFEALAFREQPTRIVSLDPNIRPSFVRDEKAYRARLARMIAATDIVKVSEEDLDWLAPGRAFADLAGEWIGAGTALVVLTRGADGALALTRSGEIAVPALPATVVDTVGAGDSFNGGLLAGLSRAGLLERSKLRAASPGALRPALELAAKVAAVTVSRAGANPPWAHEIGV